MREARLNPSQLLLLTADNTTALARSFAGRVVSDLDADIAAKTIYVDGAISAETQERLRCVRNVRIVDGAVPPGAPVGWRRVRRGAVPLDVHGLGVVVPELFDPSVHHFGRILDAHDFQELTESTKPAKARRKGIYLSPVTSTPDGLRFQLLRCSTNLSGPTESFKPHDWHIVNAANDVADRLFDGHAKLNHVLAQVYRNTPATTDAKQKKAAIKAHADKTKDMPTDGIMAFCTFYDDVRGFGPVANDPYDLAHQGQSVLTRLVFRRKLDVDDDTLPPTFSVALYPNSVFFMPLSTNRLYTHEIRPSGVDAAHLPTRLGYVVRCSATEALHHNGVTYLLQPDGRHPLVAPTVDGMRDLRDLYAQENKLASVVDYGTRFRFSMNQGDYEPPTWTPADAFRQYALDVDGELFAKLSSAAPLEPVAKGRIGGVLVDVSDARGTPLVRTTTSYTQAAAALSTAHCAVADKIRDVASLPTPFNNALVEVYDNASFKMGMHSDQALDLVEGSVIALFSCYEDPHARAPLRRLVVQSKGGGDAVDIPLPHGSVVVFDVDTNRRFKHKIVLDVGQQPLENRWLGITFRTSKTFIRHGADGPVFADGAPLTLAGDDERQRFVRLRRRENCEPDFVYPRLTTTLSAGDLLPPTT